MARSQTPKCRKAETPKEGGRGREGGRCGGWGLGMQRLRARCGDRPRIGWWGGKVGIDHRDPILRYATGWGTRHEVKRRKAEKPKRRKKAGGAEKAGRCGCWGRCLQGLQVQTAAIGSELAGGEASSESIIVTPSCATRQDGPPGPDVKLSTLTQPSPCEGEGEGGAIF
jgi:hypothetical protein